MENKEYKDMHIYKSIVICDETIMNLKHCLDRVFQTPLPERLPEPHVDFWPFDIKYIIEEWEKAKPLEGYVNPKIGTVIDCDNPDCPDCNIVSKNCNVALVICENWIEP